MEVGDLIVVKGPWASEPRAKQDAHDVFMIEGEGVDSAELERQFELWWKEGRTQPGGPLILGEGFGDRIVTRDDAR